MAVGARLRSKAANSLPRRRPRRQGVEEAAAILEHLELEEEVAENAASAGRPGARSARRVHLAVLPERYEPLEEPAPGDKPKKKYRQKLKKYGKVGPPPQPHTALRGAPAPIVPRESWSPVPTLRRRWASLSSRGVPVSPPRPPAVQH